MSNKFPMSPEETIRVYGKQLSQYERDEIMDYQQIYYLNLNQKTKGIGKYNHGELTC